MTASRLPGVYVHVPFCFKRCDYCDFTTFADRDEMIPAYVDALCVHIERAGSAATRVGATGVTGTSVGAGSGPASRDGEDRRDPESEEGARPVFGSVFVGGGTPTYLAPAELVGILHTIRSAHDVALGAEWTVEANPETVTSEMAEALAGAGVTRISLGAQSFDPGVLSTLGRWHDPESVPTAVRRLREAGIDRLSLDLIYGTPGETDASWRRSLDAVLALEVGHVSAYALTVEPNTPYAARVRTRPSLEPDDDVQAARMAVAEERLSAAGLRRYEVSNWALPGRESTHNLTYWRGGDWLAFGSGAHGAWEGRRWWLVRDPAKYARMVAEGVEPLGGEEVLDSEARRLERLMMGLRLVEGVPRAEVEPLDPAVVSRLMARGLLTLRGGTHLTLTESGMPLAGAVIRDLA